MTRWIAVLACAGALALPGTVWGASAPTPGGDAIHAAPRVAPKDPKAWLQEIFDRYIGPEDKTHWIDYSKTSVMRYYFEPDLVAIMLKDDAAAARQDQPPTLDGDPFIDAQEWDIKSVDIQVTPGADADHASAVVKFNNEGEDKLLKIALVRVGGNWKIHDIDYGSGQDTLRGMYKSQH